MTKRPERSGRNGEATESGFSLRRLRGDWPIWLSILIAACLTIVVYPSLPDQLPVHWNIHGEPDGWAARAYAVGIGLLLPVAVYALMWVFPQIDPRRENYPRFEGAYRLVRTAVVLLLLVLYAVMILSALGIRIDVARLTPIAVGLLFMALGNVLGKVRHNYFFGIRTPWTLADEEVWRRTHRFCAPLFVLAGLVTALGGFWGGVAAFSLTIGSAATVSVLAVVYSYRVYHARHR